MHLASTTLDDIIDELRLKYDSSVGLLDGKAIREIPNLSILLNLKKLLSNLTKNLEEAEQKDEGLLTRINERIAQINGENKRNREDGEDESVPLAKRRKQRRNDDEKGQKSGERVGKPSKKGNSDTEDHDEIKEEDEINPENGPEPTGEAAPEIDAPSPQTNSKDDPVPPEQSGSFTQNNDTRLKNPKSEFVSSQTLSASAIAELGLFSEDHNGLETQGKEYLKKKYGVALYPEHDLKRLLPGEIPNIDFSKNKPPSNQVQFTTYQLYIELFFRPFSAEDTGFCNEKNVVPAGFDKSDYDATLTPYLIPKLGPFYTDVWADEDAALRSKLSLPAAARPPADAYKPRGTFDDLDDGKTTTEDVSVGPLSSRLLSAVLSVHEAKKYGGFDGDGDDDAGDNGLNGDNGLKREDDPSVDDQSSTLLNDDDVATKLDSDASRAAADASDYHTMEERLKRELKHIGIFMNVQATVDGKTKNGNSIIDSDEWLNDKEDDEVCAEMRALQTELKGAVARNRQRKKILQPIIEEQLAYQEYCTILEDLDKQTDQAYMKRVKAKNRKRKTPETAVNTAQQQAANSGLRALLDKRRRWIDNIGRLFRPPELMKRIPDESVFRDDLHSDDDDDAVEEE